MGDQLCAVCKKWAMQSCSACASIYYCGKEHQKAHWKVHKNTCAPYKTISHQIGNGKNLIASRNIEPGDKIFTKPPFLLGPRNETKPFCLGCHQKLDEIKKYSCSKCSWSLCRKNCESLARHEEECQIFVNHKVHKKVLDHNLNIYPIITPLRIYFMKLNHPKKFATIIDLATNPVEYNSTYKYFKDFLDCIFESTVMEDEECMKIWSVYKSHGICIYSEKSVTDFIGFYPVLPLVSHSCKGNSKIVETGKNHELTLIATVPITKNDPLTTNYTDVFLGTLERQKHLKEIKSITCSCERCKDPTELGTYINSIYCITCKEETLIEDGPKIISTDPIDRNAPWTCENCGNSIPCKQIILGNMSLREEIDELDKTHPKDLEHFLFKYGEIVHPMNNHCLRVKYHLLQLYGSAKGFGLAELPDELLERKIQLCQELLNMASILDPGYSKLRGCLLYELQAAIVMQTKRRFCQDQITKPRAEEILKKSLDLLHEACKILLVEPEFRETLQSKLTTLTSDPDS